VLLSLRIAKPVAPVDFSVAMAQGWHNLPSLYGQKVRHVDPVKDFSSGARTAAKVISLIFSPLRIAIWAWFLRRIDKHLFQSRNRSTEGRWNRVPQRSGYGGVRFIRQIQCRYIGLCKQHSDVRTMGIACVYPERRSNEQPKSQIQA